MSTESNFMITILKDIRRQDPVSDYDKRLKELLKNPATVLTIFRCIDQFSQEFVQKIVRLSFHTSLDPSKQETILKVIDTENYYPHGQCILAYLQKRLLDENYPFTEFTKGHSDLAKFKLITFKEKGQTNGFINSYLDIVTNGLSTQIDLQKKSPPKIKHEKSDLEMKSKQQWKKICNQLMLMAQNPANYVQSNTGSKYSQLVMEVFKQILSVEGKNGSGVIN